MLRFPFKLAQHIIPTEPYDTEVLTMRTWVITAMAKPEGDCWICRCTPKLPSPYLHPCAVLSKYSQNFTICSATQDEHELHNVQPKLHNSADRGIQICLPAPSSSCVFLPTTACLALVVRSYIPSNSVNWRVWGGFCCFFNGISRLALILPYWLLRIQVSGPRKYHHSRVLYFLKFRNWSSGLARASNTDCWDVSWRNIGSDALEEVFCVSFNIVCT